MCVCRYLVLLLGISYMKRRLDKCMFDTVVEQVWMIFGDQSLLNSRAPID